MPTHAADVAGDAVFSLSHNLEAPRALVWAAWTDPLRIAAWLGPKGAPPGRVIDHALRVGGVFLSAMKMPDGSEVCAKFVYRRITPISRLEWVHSFADVNGGLVRHPLSPTWPMELLTTVTFVERGEGTEITLVWAPLGADAVELETFKAGKPGMQAGWTGSFERLAVRPEPGPHIRHVGSLSSRRGAR